MTALNTYRRWLARVEDDALRAELSALDEVRDAAQIEDRFYRDLAFGTGGLRGVLGAGTNRMNVYVVRRATQGLAAYLKAAGLPRRCAIAYDSRIGSARFARETARVLAANGVTAYLYPRLEPTPALSWAVRLSLIHILGSASRSSCALREEKASAFSRTRSMAATSSWSRKGFRR